MKSLLVVFVPVAIGVEVQPNLSPLSNANTASFNIAACPFNIASAMR